MQARISSHSVPQESSMSTLRRPAPSSSATGAFSLSLAAMFLLVAALLCAVVPQTHAQSGANSDPNYVALRNLTLGSEAVSVTNLDLKRDAGTFRFNSGTVCFTPAVNGKVTGA